MQNPKSEFEVRVVRVGPLVRHPNADTLSITHVDAYPVIVKTGSILEGDLAVYIPVDALVPVDHPCFNFLKGTNAQGQHRVKAARLRGIFSMGFLVPAPNYAKEGDDVAAHFRVEKYLTVSERNEAKAVGFGKKGPVKRDPGFMPVYGLDSFRRNPFAVPEGTHVVLTEKIHGCNARYAYRNGRFYVGSHKTMRGMTKHRVVQWLQQQWLKVKRHFGFGGRTHLMEQHGDVWWEMARQYDLETKCRWLNERTGQRLTLYGEIYGEGVQDLVYDSPKGRKFRAFDLYDQDERRFLSWGEFQEACRLADIPTVPLIEWDVPWSKDLLKSAEGRSTLNLSHVREGFVARPMTEGPHHAAFKVIGEGYMLRKDEAAEAA